MATFRPRQFSTDDADWDRALQDPNVRRALRDPQVSQAMAQIISSQQQPQGMAQGGSADGVPDPMTTNKWQQLQDAMKSESEPTRYADGGYTGGEIANMDEQQLIIADRTATGSEKAQIEARLDALRAQRAAAQGGVSGFGQNLSGIQKMTQPVSPFNTGASMIWSGLMGLGVQGNISPGARIGAALLSAGLGGLFNYLIRKHHQQQQAASGASGTGGTGQQNVTNAGTVTAPSTATPLPTPAQIAAKSLPGQTTQPQDQNALTQSGADQGYYTLPETAPPPPAPATETGANVPPPTPEEQRSDAELEQQGIARGKKWRAIKEKLGAQYDPVYGFRTDDRDLDRPRGAPGSVAPQTTAPSVAQPPADQGGMTYTIPGIGISDAEGRHWQNIPWPVGIPAAPGPPSGLGAAANSNLPGMAPTPQAKTPADYRPPTETSPASQSGPADPGTPLGPPGLPPTKEHPHGVPDPTWQKLHPEDYPLSDYAKGGEVHEDATEDRKQMLSILREKKLIKKARGGFAEKAAEDLPAPPNKRGKPILLRKPAGLPIPILHTTIIIAKAEKGKKKSEKKAEGGTIELPESRLDQRARKPRAIPPIKGPENDHDPGDKYSPYLKGGRVQVPRGSGAASKGRRFSGIY